MSEITRDSTSKKSGKIVPWDVQISANVGFLSKDVCPLLASFGMEIFSGVLSKT